jgi:hypothetical protein
VTPKKRGKASEIGAKHANPNEREKSEGRGSNKRRGKWSSLPFNNPFACFAANQLKFAFVFGLSSIFAQLQTLSLIY